MSKIIKFIYRCLMFLVNCKDKLFVKHTCIERKRLYISNYIKSNKDIVIVTSLHTIFVAKNLLVALKKHGISCSLLVKNDRKSKVHFSNKNVYIILCGIWLHFMPKYYIYYNQEQTTYSEHFPKHLIFSKYFHFFHKAAYCFDYSLMNIKWFSKRIHVRINYLPVLPAYSKPIINTNKINIAFVGEFYGNNRRQQMLNKISSSHKVVIRKECFGNELNELYSKTSIILNIHRCEKSVLETVRIFDAMQHNCLVISEESEDSLTHYKKLYSVVDFVKLGNTSAFIERIEYWKKHQSLLDKRKKTINNYVINCSKQFDKYISHLSKILLICDNS